MPHATQLIINMASDSIECYPMPQQQIFCTHPRLLPWDGVICQSKTWQLRCLHSKCCCCCFLISVPQSGVCLNGSAMKYILWSCTVKSCLWSFNFICAQLELIFFGGTNCRTAAGTTSRISSRTRRHADWHCWYADNGMKIAICTTVVRLTQLTLLKNIHLLNFYSVFTFQLI